MKNQPQITSAFDTVWEEVHAAEEWGKVPPEYVVRAIARAFKKHPIKKEIRILDMGCGQGACTIWLAREGYTVYAVDGSESALLKCTKRLAEENLEALLLCCDFLTLPFEDGYFDAVIDNFTLCCVPPSVCPAVVAEVWRILKPGGIFISGNFTWNTWGFGTGTEIEPNCFVGVTEGPLTGRGTQHFMSLAAVHNLYCGFCSRNIECESRSMENGTKLIEWWTITATK